MLDAGKVDVIIASLITSVVSLITDVTCTLKFIAHEIYMWYM